ncbi:MAG: hypothetical protein ACFFHD_08440 [Promethearchaeota archaeon]
MPHFSSIFDLEMLEKIFQPLLQFLKVLNDYMYVFFQYGNLIFFLNFLIMGIILLFHTREIEYNERIHIKIEIIKRKGRIGAAIFIIMAFLFLSGILTSWLYNLFSILPEPQVLLGYIGSQFSSITSLKEIDTLTVFQANIFFLINFISFVSLLLLFISLYLMFFNKSILHFKLKFSVFLFLGIFFWILVGFRTSLQLLV